MNVRVRDHPLESLPDWPQLSPSYQWEREAPLKVTCMVGADLMFESRSISILEFLLKTQTTMGHAFGAFSYSPLDILTPHNLSLAWR